MLETKVDETQAPEILLRAKYHLPEPGLSPERQQRRAIAIHKAVADDIENAKDFSQKAWTQHETQFNRFDYDARTETKDRVETILTEDLMETAEEKVEKINSELYRAFRQAATQIGYSNIDTRQLQGYANDKYKSILNKMYKTLKDETAAANERAEQAIEKAKDDPEKIEKAQAQLDQELEAIREDAKRTAQEDLLYLRRAIDRGAPAEPPSVPNPVPGFDERSSEPYFDAKQGAVNEMNGKLDGFDKGFWEDVNNLLTAHKNNEDDEAHEVIRSFEGKLDDLGEVFSYDEAKFAEAIQKEVDNLYELFEEELGKRKATLLELAAKENTVEAQEEIMALYQDIAKRTFAQAKNQSQQHWETISKAVEQAAQGDYAKLQQELKQRHYERYIKPFNEKPSNSVVLSTGTHVPFDGLETDKEYNLTKSGDVTLTKEANGDLVMRASFPHSSSSPTWQLALFGGGIGGVVGLFGWNKFKQGRDAYKKANIAREFNSSLESFSAMADPGQPVFVFSSDPKKQAAMVEKMQALGHKVIGGRSLGYEGLPSKFEQSLTHAGEELRRTGKKITGPKTLVQEGAKLGVKGAKEGVGAVSEGTKRGAEALGKLASKVVKKVKEHETGDVPEDQQSDPVEEATSKHSAPDVSVRPHRN